MMTADVRQALLQCPGEGHISAPIQCDKHNQQGQHPIYCDFSVLRYKMGC